MNSLLPILPFLMALALAQDRTAPNTDPDLCQCPKNFVAERTSKTGEYSCYGVKLRMMRPCNQLKRPECVCTEATSVLHDRTGTWCAQYGGGREVRRWACENTQQWEEFFERHPDQKLQEVYL